MTTANAAPITIALAQLPVSKAAVDGNLQTHLAYIEHAAAVGANVVAFPELSLTGYELALLSQLAMPRNDKTFAALTAAAVATNTAVIAGCPCHRISIATATFSHSLDRKPTPPTIMSALITTSPSH